MVLKNKENPCKICGAKSSIIKRYGLNICRRCFKESAPELGFKKLN